MMAIGLKTLEYSAHQASLDDAKASNKAAGIESDGDEQPISKGALAATMTFSILVGLCMFVVVPNLATHFLGKVTLSSGQPFLEENAPLTYNLISGAIRMCIIVGYIYAISLMPDVKRLFRYHGAEHKAVSAFEAGKSLTVDNVRPFTIFHPRCGTTFIAITLMVSVLVFAVFARILVNLWPDFYQFHFAVRKTILISGHILMMPIVAGVCFELLRLGGKYTNNILLKLLITPGFWFQRLTVKEPDDSMIEVAIESLQLALALPEPILEPARARAQETAEAATA
jgi:uncharacterized protein YqhQ